MKNKYNFLHIIYMIIASTTLAAQAEFRSYSTAINLSIYGESIFYSTSYQSPNGFITDIDHAVNPNNFFAQIKNEKEDWYSANWGVNFGKFYAGSQLLRIDGAEVRTFKSSSGNVCGATLFYRTSAVEELNKPAFESQKLNYFSGCDYSQLRFNDVLGGGCNTYGYQKFLGFSGFEANSFASVDLTDAKEGQYLLEFYYKTTGGNSEGCEDAFYDNNQSTNYRGQYTICPSFEDVIGVKHATCDDLGQISIEVKGIENGVFSDRFFYGDDDIPFKDVKVLNGVVLLSNLEPKEYKNIRYQSKVSGCSEIINTTVIITDENPLAMPKGDQVQYFCPIYQPKVADLIVEGSVIWYATETGGIAINPLEILENDKTYYASQTNSSCESERRLGVKVMINGSICNQANVVVTIKTETTDVNIGDVIDFSVFAENLGSIQTTGVEVSTLLSDGFEYLSHSFEGTDDDLGNYSPVTGLWQIGKLDPITTSSILKISAKVRSIGDYKVISKVSINEQDIDLTNNIKHLQFNIMNLIISPSASVNCDLGYGKGKIEIHSPVGGGYSYSLGSGAAQSSPVFENLDNGEYVVDIMNSENKIVSKIKAIITCSCVKQPTISKGEIEAFSCDLSPVTINNIKFSDADVVKLSTNGSGNFNMNSFAISPFNLIYTPTVEDLGKVIEFILKTENDAEIPCGTASFTYKINFSDCNLGVSEIEKNEGITIYPNPTTNFLNISIDSGKIIRSVEIYSVDGQLVMSGIEVKNNRVDVTELSHGSYTLKVNVDGEIIVSRFVKQ